MLTWDEVSIPLVVSELASWMVDNDYHSEDIVAMLSQPWKYRPEYLEMLQERLPC